MKSRYPERRPESPLKPKKINDSASRDLSSAKFPGRKTALPGPIALPSTSSTNHEVSSLSLEEGKGIYLTPHKKARARLQNLQKISQDVVSSLSAVSRAAKALPGWLPTTAVPQEGIKRKPAKIKYTSEEMHDLAKMAKASIRSKQDHTSWRRDPRSTVKMFLQSHHPDLVSDASQKPVWSFASRSTPKEAPANSAAKTSPPQVKALPKSNAQQSKAEKTSQPSQSQPQLPAHKSGPAFLPPIVIAPHQHSMALAGMIPGSLPSTLGMPAVAYHLSHTSEYPMPPLLPATCLNSGQKTPRMEDGFYKTTNPIYEEQPTSSYHQPGTSGQSYAFHMQAAAG